MDMQPVDVKKGDVMIVDDTPANLNLLFEILVTYGYKVRPFPNGVLALQAIQAMLPDLILLDIKMPELDGYEVCARLKADPATRDIPVIFISALDELKDKVKGFKVGGVDYITKPFQMAEVLARVQTHLTIRCLQTELQVANKKLAEQLHESERLNAELHERNEELQESLRTIKTLSGLVPICAWCHKTIKNEEGRWMNLETYIEAHSEAKFTHGMCPDCLQKFEHER